jgi:uncharacterized protein YigE (DUF2233 family)
MRTNASGRASGQRLGSTLGWQEPMRTCVFAFSACLLAPFSAEQNAVAEPAPCRAVTYESNSYTVCEVDLRRQTIRLFWKRPDGIPYGFLNALPPSLDERSAQLVFATNAGMFDPAHKPVGLYVENGHELVHANTKSGWGNFHLKPNGIFYVDGERAGVLETGAYLKQQLHPDMATQSGPMLVINGRLHPRFVRANVSLKQRSGVGVRDAHTIVFAISGNPVSFAAFARLFRDRTKCDNALFLDGGNVPSLYVPELKQGYNVLPLGPMIGVFERPRPADSN